MENQINAGDQNTQQIEQNPVSQPVSMSEKPKVNYWMISTIVLSLLLFGTGSLYFLNLNAQKTQLPNVNLAPTNTPQTQPTVIDSGPAVVTTVPDTVPKENSLYLGKYQGKEVLFTRNCFEANEDRLSYLRLDTWKNRILNNTFKDEDYKYIGSIAVVKGNEVISDAYPYDYRKLENPKRILSDKTCFSTAGLQGVGLYNENKGTIYTSLVFGENSNKIYKVDLNSLTSVEIWSHTTGNPNDKKYDGYYGNASLETVRGSYLILSIWDCTQCSPPAEQRVSVILNTDTKSEKYLGLVGNISINLDKRNVSFQKLSPVKESCAGCVGMCPGCDASGQKTVYKPAGEFLTEPLP